MRKIAACLGLVLFCAVSALAQSASATQTARQALLEMFFSKTSGTFVKHLPMATREALGKSGALNSLQSYSLMMSQLQTQGQNVQTFETGTLLLTADNSKTGDKAEITVEKDALRGDQDDIELTFHVYKNGQEQRTPFMPRVTFSMKQEAQIWKLNEIAVTIHVPLADPDFLKALSEKMTPQVSASTTLPTQSGTSAPRQASFGSPAQTAGSDDTVLAAMQTILAAEKTYAATYPTVGYSCTLSSLDGFGGGEPNAHQAMLINSGLASGKKYGFVFTLSGCTAAPSTRFQLTAVPNGDTFGRTTFCADQSGAIRTGEDATTCMAGGMAAKK